MQKLFIVAAALCLTIGCGAEETEEVEAPAEEKAPEAAPKKEAPKENGLAGQGSKDDPKVLTCSTKAKELGEFKEGLKAWVQCPSDCSSGAVWGTCTYTLDSSICVAANHAGALPGKPFPGGTVMVMSAPGISGGEGYIGSVQDGISSSSWSSYDASMTFKNMKAADCAGAAPPKGGKKGGGKKGKKRKH